MVALPYAASRYRIFAKALGGGSPHCPATVRGVRPYGANPEAGLGNRPDVNQGADRPQRVSRL